MEWLDRISAKKGIVGVEVLPEGLALVAKGCRGDSNAIDELTLISNETDGDDLVSEFIRFVDKYKISKRLCHLILTSKDYQLLLVEAPEVAAEELREAMRWRIKDLISMPLEKAVVDVFELPKDANRSAKKMVYVVVANLDRIQSLIDLVNTAGLTLASIDIGEMALRNISLVLDGGGTEGRGVGVARIQEGGGVVSLYREGNLYLSRQFQLAYQGGLLDDLPVESLALEIQRSLDYYERQMGLSPPAALYLCGENITADKITVELTRSITVPTKFLDLSETQNISEGIEEGMLQLCLGALGGAMRKAV